MNNVTWSVAVSQLDLGRLKEEVGALESAGCGELHFDVMDGRFTPDFGVGTDVIAAARACSALPCEAHLMIERPERHVDRFIELGCASIVVHAEACAHAHRVLAQIRDAGASPGVAIYPGSSLTKLEYLLSSADRVLLLTADAPDAAVYERVKILRENIAYKELRCRIEVEGRIDAKRAALLASHGADVFVLDTPDATTPDGLAALRDRASAEARVV